MRVILTMTLLLAVSSGISLGQMAPRRPQTTTPSAGANPPATQPGGTRSGKTAVDDEYADCMQLWDPGTHMTKEQWSATCRRVQSRLNQVQSN